VSELRWLLLGGSQVDDKALKQIQGAKNLQQLSLFLCPVTDMGISRLEQLPNLRILNVALTKIADTGCRSLAQIEALEELVLDETRVTDDGLKFLNSLGELKHLSLAGLRVSDRGLAVLKTMNGLESLNVARTQVTAQAVGSFQSALPNCRVQWNGDPTDYRAQSRVRQAYHALSEKEAEVRRFSLREIQRDLLGVCFSSGEGLNLP
ncbi:MAG: hypothetical protein ACR2NM_17615, partial [Bythopirellula sp.]